MTSVRSVMSRPTAVIDAETTVDEAVVLMAKDHLRHLPVVREGRVVGFLSDHELVDRRRGAGLAQRPFGDLRVRMLMTSRPLSVEAGMALVDAVDLMVEHQLKAIPVVDAEQRLVGVLSVVEVVRELARRLPPAPDAPAVPRSG